MGFLPKKWLSKLWGVTEPPRLLDKPIDCDACRIARANGGDACWEHHVHHRRPHLYRAGHEINWGSGLDAMGAHRDFVMPSRVSGSEVIERVSHPSGI
jgi:hypothetical protein